VYTDSSAGATEQPSACCSSPANTHCCSMHSTHKQTKYTHTHTYTAHKRSTNRQLAAQAHRIPPTSSKPFIPTWSCERSMVYLPPVGPSGWHPRISTGLSMLGRSFGRSIYVHSNTICLNVLTKNKDMKCIYYSSFTRGNLKQKRWTQCCDSTVCSWKPSCSSHGIGTAQSQEDIKHPDAACICCWCSSAPSTVMTAARCRR